MVFFFIILFLYNGNLGVIFNKLVVVFNKGLIFLWVILEIGKIGSLLVYLLVCFFVSCFLNFVKFFFVLGMFILLVIIIWGCFIKCKLCEVNFLLIVK